jgi:hypothetical protein
MLSVGFIVMLNGEALFDPANVYNLVQHLRVRSKPARFFPAKLG